MAETQATYITRIREALDEDTARFWDEAEIRRWINDAAQEIARRTEILQDIDTITAVAGTAEYTLGADALRVHRVEFNYTGESAKRALEFRPFNAMDNIWWSHQDITRSAPAFYTVWGFTPNLKMRVFPVPDSGGTLTVYFYRLPAKLATASTTDASTTLDIPNGWEDLVVYYAEYRALRKDRDPRWQEAKGLFEEKVDELLVMTRHYADQAGVMVSASGQSWVPAWLYGGDY